MKFQIQSTDNRSQARAGSFSTGHGLLETPIFMPVGTGGTVKAVHQHELADDINAPVILGNTYHLYLRPGTAVLKEAGGLHRFMNWNRTILTDSGGYQVFSMAANRKLTAEGAWFSSHIDGSRHLFSPEGVVDIQRLIGSDLTMAFDECTPWPCEEKYARDSMELTHDWLLRGIERFRQTEPLYGHEQFFLPIVQGSVFADLRKRSAEFIARQDMPANAIGGLSVGEPVEIMYEMIEVVNSILPVDKPRYLMGVGTPVNLLEAISRGMDMFDCVMPTRNGRNGMLFTSKGIMNIKNEKWKFDFSPIDVEGCSVVDRNYSKAYLRHLVTSGERLGAQIASIHNLAFYLWLVREARKHIFSGDFSNWKDIMIPRLSNRL
ncbi:MAG: tRNA guanosine(34) transglycosylase Tgt [Bacteroidetes bacterium GWF2_49_14]|nr:MAG: tRNA guanosine(34) transglycosylase Tgt [Bacteroidetes bacterium GWF2_49_14]